MNVCLYSRACLQLGLEGDSFDEERLEHPSAYESNANNVAQIPDETLVGESGKMQVGILMHAHLHTHTSIHIQTHMKLPPHPPFLYCLYTIWELFWKICYEKKLKTI